MNIEKNNLLNNLENYITGLNPWNDLTNIFSAKDNDDWDSDEEFDNDDWEDEDFDDEELEEREDDDWDDENFDDEELEEGEDDDWDDEDEWEDEDFYEEELDDDEEDEWDDFEEESEEDEDWEDDHEEELEFGSFNKKSSKEARNLSDSLKNLKDGELTLDRYDKSLIKLYDSLLLKEIDLLNVINVKIRKFDKYRLN